MATPAAPNPRRARRTGAVLVAALVTLSVGAPPLPAAAGGLQVDDLTDDQVTAVGLAQSLEGDGVSVDVDSVTHTGHDRAAGAFRGGGGIVGLDEGIVLSSGHADAVVGPNADQFTSHVLGTPGDQELTDIVGTATYDASILEFDFSVAAGSDEVFFSYVFGSEEYNLYVGSAFNDVFAFFVNGENCAVIGDPAVEVSVNTINNGTTTADPVNPDLFVNNDPWTADATGNPVPQDALADTEMNGFTVPLTCEAAVQPGTNTMRLAIADTADAALDSWVLIGGGSLSVAPPDPDPEPDPDPVDPVEPEPIEDDDARVSGADRVGTAISISEEFPDAPAVVLARSDDYPDALAGAPLATTVDGPILLTPSHELLPEVRQEIQRLGASEVHLLGGNAALSAGVEQELRALGLDTIRYAGENRFATAVMIAEEIPPHPVDPGVYLVEGAHDDPRRGWPDAVSVSAGAAYAQIPILLTWEDRLPEEAALALTDGDLGIRRAVIVGGDAAVSDWVGAEVDWLTPEPLSRVWGADRYATSAAVTNALLDAGMSVETTWVATGRSFPDALAAAPLAGSTAPRVASEAGALLLVDGTRGIHGDSPYTREWLQGHANQIERVRAVGGDGVITPTTLVEIQQAAAVD